MTTRKRSEDALRALCGERYEDDGVSPRHERRGGESRDGGRKDLQLCKQVMRALNDALQAEAGHGLLKELVVRRVEPAPDASRVCVHVEASERAEMAGASRIMAALEGAGGFLRTQVAAAISRKRVPTLIFTLVVQEESVHEEE